MLDKILNDVNQHGFSIINDFIDKKTINLAREEYFSIMQNQSIHSQREKFTLDNLNKNAWRKTAVGSGNGLGHPISQVLQTTYFKETNPNVTNLTASANEAVFLRNLIDGRRREFGFNPADDGFWNATRVHHYPQGGGFMSSHKDTYFPQAMEQDAKLFLQFAVLLSSKGIDFYEGGSFVVSMGGEKIMLDDKGEAGTLVIFDGRLNHGVDDIDPDQVLDWKNEKGRIAIFSNLYEYNG